MEKTNPEKQRKNTAVAARLRSLRSDDPLSEGHPRFIEQELETWKTFQTHIQTTKLTNLSI